MKQSRLTPTIKVAMMTILYDSHEILWALKLQEGHLQNIQLPIVHREDQNTVSCTYKMTSDLNPPDVSDGCLTFRWPCLSNREKLLKPLEARRYHHKHQILLHPPSEFYLLPDNHSHFPIRCTEAFKKMLCLMFDFSKLQITGNSQSCEPAEFGGFCSSHCARALLSFFSCSHQINTVLEIPLTWPLLSFLFKRHWRKHKY